VRTGRRAWLEALLAALDPQRDVVVAGLGANARYLPHLGVRVPHFALCDSMGAPSRSGSGWRSLVPTDAWSSSRVMDHCS
jgi:hypothetical protein